MSGGVEVVVRFPRDLALESRGVYSTPLRALADLQLIGEHIGAWQAARERHRHDVQALWEILLSSREGMAWPGGREPLWLLARGPVEALVGVLVAKQLQDEEDSLRLLFAQLCERAAVAKMLTLLDGVRAFPTMCKKVPPLSGKNFLQLGAIGLGLPLYKTLATAWGQHPVGPLFEPEISKVPLSHRQRLHELRADLGTAGWWAVLGRYEGQLASTGSTEGVAVIEKLLDFSWQDDGSGHSERLLAFKHWPLWRLALFGGVEQVCRTGGPPDLLRLAPEAAACGLGSVLVLGRVRIAILSPLREAEGAVDWMDGSVSFARFPGGGTKGGESHGQQKPHVEGEAGNRGGRARDLREEVEQLQERLADAECLIHRQRKTISDLTHLVESRATKSVSGNPVLRFDECYDDNTYLAYGIRWQRAPLLDSAGPGVALCDEHGRAFVPVMRPQPADGRERWRSWTKWLGVLAGSGAGIGWLVSELLWR